MLTQEDKVNVEIVKKIMSEKKTTLPLLRNQDWTKAKVKTEKGKTNRQHHWTKRVHLSRRVKRGGKM